MALRIKTGETDRQAHALAERARETLTDAVAIALRDRLKRDAGDPVKGGELG